MKKVGNSWEKNVNEKMVRLLSNYVALIPLHVNSFVCNEFTHEFTHNTSLLALYILKCPRLTPIKLCKCH